MLVLAILARSNALSCAYRDFDYSRLGCSYIYIYVSKVRGSSSCGRNALDFGNVALLYSIATVNI